MSFSGIWRIMSSPDFDDDYLSEEIEPYVRLRKSGDRIDGEYHVGLQSGEIDGRFEGEGRIIFSFAGMDEMEEVNGAGTITLDGDDMIFTLMYHQGDDYTFECERGASPKKARSKKRP
jgi:hypothetical protein